MDFIQNVDFNVLVIFSTMFGSLLLSLLTLINILNTSEYDFTRFNTTVVETELKQFFGGRFKTIYLDTKITIIVSTLNYVASDIINWYLKRTCVEYLLFSNCNKKHNSSDYKNLQSLVSPTIFILTEIHRIKNTLEDIKNCRVWFPNSNIFFMILDEVHDQEVLESTLETIWSQELLNFVVIYVNSKVNFVTYNGFNEDKIVHLTNFSEMFPNKLLDVNGHVVKVGFFEDAPRNLKNTQGQWFGPDYYLLETIIDMMNATLEIVEVLPNKHFGALHNNLLSRTIDFSFIPYYRVENFDDIEFSYPRQLENLVVLVPKATEVPPQQYLFMIYGEKTAIAIVISLVVIAYLLKKSTANKDRGFFYWLVISWKCFVGTGGTSNFSKKNFSVKLILTLWMLVSIILSAAFQCSFTSTLAKPKLLKNINTLEELKLSGMEILCPDHFRNYFLQVDNHGLENQLVYVNSEKIISFRKGESIGNNAFIESSSRATVLSELYGYHTVRESFATGYQVYFFQKHSPYIEEIHRSVLIDQETGLSKGKDLMATTNKHYDDKNKKNLNLTLHHLQGIFITLLFGHMFGFILFVCELYLRNK